MGRVVIVPGLAVRSYAEPAAQALRDLGHDVALPPAPAWRGTPADLGAYGRELGAQLDERGEGVDLLVGLCVGTQAAAGAAAYGPVRRLLLVSATVPPVRRSLPRLFATWARGDGHRDSPSFAHQVPDWTHAGIPRILAGFASATRVDLEEVLPRSSARLTVVHADHDNLGSLDFASALCAANHGRLVIMPDAPHSWPIADSPRFVDLVTELLEEPAGA